MQLSETQLDAIGISISKLMPTGHSFALVIFENTTPQKTTYISNTHPSMSLTALTKTTSGISKTLKP